MFTVKLPNRDFLVKQVHARKRRSLNPNSPPRAVVRAQCALPLRRPAAPPLQAHVLEEPHGGGHCAPGSGLRPLEAAADSAQKSPRTLTWASAISLLISVWRRARDYSSLSSTDESGREK